MWSDLIDTLKLFWIWDNSYLFHHISIVNLEQQILIWLRVKEGEIVLRSFIERLFADPKQSFALRKIEY